MAGRSRLDQTRRRVIHCDAQGVLFVEAEAESTSLDDLGDLAPRPEFRRLVPEARHADDDPSGEHPLFLLQLTRFRCGGASLGVAFHHILGDGTSLGQFMHTWADMARCLPGGTATPFHERSALAARHPPTPCFPHLEYAEPPSLASGPAGADADALSESVTAIFRLSAADLEVLKAQANEGGPPGRCSTYEAVAAHVWRCACEARALPSGQETQMRMPVNGRPRLRPPLPPGYFGNAIFTTGAAGELRGNPLAVAAGRVREALARMDDGYMRSALDHLEKRPDLPTLSRGARTFRSPNIALTSWVNLRLSDFDFGWGKPAFMSPAEVPFEGFGYLLPSPAAGDERSLSVSVVIRLQPEAMERWKNVFYDFRWWRNSRQRSKL
uniref:Hydroxycinnamoyl-Coenzyme A shikimate/quinate hydroxycinnamoyltransferase n=1 Tax=Anthurium amnicola TaxID=1678845 RepID=A0A1D1YWI7_9ARAE